MSLYAIDRDTEITFYAQIAEVLERDYVRQGVPGDAKLLGINQNRPVLRVKSLNVLEQDGTPVEYAITRFRADRIQLRITP